MNKEVFKKFPAFVVREQKQEKIATAFSTSLRRCQNAYAELKRMPDIGDVPCELSMCTAGLFDAHIDEVIEKIKSEVTMTQAVKEETTAEWEKIRSEALAQVNIIARFLAAYPQAKIEVSGSSVECINSVELLNDLSKEAVPEGCEQHYALIREAAEVLGRLYDFQKENNIHLANEQILKYADDPEELAKLWLFEKEMQRFKDAQNNTSGVRMNDGKTISDVNEEHRKNVREQAAKKAQLKQDFYDKRKNGTIEEVQLNAIPITI